MKAIIVKSGMETLHLKDVDRPVAGDNEVLVKVRAATVTPSDVIGMGGFFLTRHFGGKTKPNEPIPGVEFAGDVEEIGKAVRRFKVGDPVLGSSIGYGAWAQYIRVSEEGTLALKPSNMDYAEAAGVCDGGITSLFFLRNFAGVSAGKKILINGASGSVGTFAVQLAKHYNAVVTAVCSTANTELVKSLGADKVLDYTKEDFTKSGLSYDIVFDAVGKSSFSRCRDLLTPNGIYLTTVPSPGRSVAKAFYLWAQR